MTAGRCIQPHAVQRALSAGNPGPGASGHGVNIVTVPATCAQQQAAGPPPGSWQQMQQAAAPAWPQVAHWAPAPDWSSSCTGSQQFCMHAQPMLQDSIIDGEVMGCSGTTQPHACLALRQSHVRMANAAGMLTQPAAGVGLHTEVDNTYMQCTLLSAVPHVCGRVACSTPTTPATLLHGCHPCALQYMRAVDNKVVSCTSMLPCGCHSGCERSQVNLLQHPASSGGLQPRPFLSAAQQYAMQPGELWHAQLRAETPPLGALQMGCSVDHLCSTHVHMRWGEEATAGCLKQHASIHSKPHHTLIPLYCYIAKQWAAQHTHWSLLLLSGQRSAPRSHTPTGPRPPQYQLHPPPPPHTRSPQHQGIFSLAHRRGLGWQWVDGDVQAGLNGLDKVNGLLHGGLDHHKLADPCGQPVLGAHHLLTRLRRVSAGGHVSVHDEKDVHFHGAHVKPVD